jgi:hypothetical protein
MGTAVLCCAIFGLRVAARIARLEKPRADREP